MCNFTFPMSTTVLNQHSFHNVNAPCRFVERIYWTYWFLIRVLIHWKQYPLILNCGKVWIRAKTSFLDISFNLMKRPQRSFHDDINMVYRIDAKYVAISVYEKYRTLIKCSRFEKNYWKINWEDFWKYFKYEFYLSNRWNHHQVCHLFCTSNDIFRISARSIMLNVIEHISYL